MAGLEFLVRNYRPLQPGAGPLSGLCYQEQAPAPALQDLVYCYWTLRGSPEPTLYSVVADGCVDLLLECQPPYGAWVAVSPAQAFQVELPARSIYFGVRWLPGAFPRMFRADAGELLGGQPTLDIMLDAAGAEWQAQVQQASSMAEQRALTDAYLLARRAHADAPVLDPRLAQALYHLLCSHGNARIQSQAADWISPRQLRRLFAHYIGLPPKVFARIVRFQTALRHLPPAPAAADWAAAVEAAGYFDQPHLLRDFRQFRGRLIR